jgi:hypothetical protein
LSFLIVDRPTERSPNRRRFFPKHHSRQQIEIVFSNLETEIGHEPLSPLKTVAEPLTQLPQRWRRELTCSREFAVMVGGCASGSVPIRRRAVSPSTGGTDARQYLEKKKVDDEYEWGLQPVMATFLLMVRDSKPYCSPTRTAVRAHSAASPKTYKTYLSRY